MSTRAERKAEIVAMFAGMKSITIHRENDDTIELFTPDAEDKVMKKAERAMKRGAAVSHDGIREWVHFEEIFPEVWHDDGDRTRHEVARYKKDDKTGDIVRTVDKLVWRKYA